MLKAGSPAFIVPGSWCGPVLTRALYGLLAERLVRLGLRPVFVPNPHGGMVRLDRIRNNLQEAVKGNLFDSNMKSCVFVTHSLGEMVTAELLQRNWRPGYEATVFSLAGPHDGTEVVDDVEGLLRQIPLLGRVPFRWLFQAVDAMRYAGEFAQGLRERAFPNEATFYLLGTPFDECVRPWESSWGWRAFPDEIVAERLLLAPSPESVDDERAITFVPAFVEHVLMPVMPAVLETIADRLKPKIQRGKLAVVAA